MNSNAALRLPCWNDGAAKSALLGFIADAVDPESPGYIPPEERIAVSDMDGTVLTELGAPLSRLNCCECAIAARLTERRRTTDSPADVYARGVLSRYETMAERFKHTPPSGDEFTEFWRLYYALVASSQSGMTVEEVYDAVEAILCEEYGGGITFRDVFYAPMLALYRLLRENGFAFYIVSASNRSMIYPLCRSALAFGGRDYEFTSCIGTDNVKERVELSSGAFRLVQTGEYEKPNTDFRKAVYALRHIGRTPVLAFGNSSSDGDLLRWTQSNPRRRSLAVIINHDDAEREYLYGAEKMSAMSDSSGWLCVSMKRDFSTVFD